MSQENVSRLRARYEAAEPGAWSGDLLAQDFELHQASSIIDSPGVYRGPDAIRDVIGDLERSFEEISVDAEEISEAPGGEIVVVLRISGRGRASGIELDNRIGHVWTFRDSKAVRMVAYEEPADALKAVGLDQ
jgi:ketosteroid isomerase-like protein